MTYDSENLQNLFNGFGTQFYKIVGGSSSKGGANKGSSFNFKLSETDKELNTENLYSNFIDLCNNLPDGTYTVILRTSPEAHKNEVAHTFTIGEVSKVGSAGATPQRTDTAIRGNDGILALMFQQMQMQMQQATESQARFF